jgi:hypothetical protein
MAIYLSSTILVFPQIYENMPTNTPKPRLDIKISDQKVMRGQSFEIQIQSYNDGDEADLQIVTVGFPLNKNLDNVKIVEYNFLQSPQLIQIGEEVGSQYTAGKETIKTKYPFVEAYSRPSKNGDSFKMTLAVTPDETGAFKIYTKSVTMPHTNNLSHFPQDGLLDQQNEFVQEFIVDIVEP